MTPGPPDRVLTGLRRVNAGIGLACGLAMLACCAFILVEIVTRRLAFGLVGGTDEISGYVMAAIASWAGGYALVERAHIRVDILHRKLAAPGRALLDIASLAGLLAVSLALLFHGWGVVAKSIARGSASNTPLETPLWIPQSIWLAGWGWFALASAILLALALAAVARRDWAGVAEIAAPETDETLGPDEGAR